MADPDHIPNLDGFDELTVRLYRSGLTIAALSLVLAGIAHLSRAVIASPEPTVWESIAWLGCLVGCASAISNMHLYAKQIRWFIGISGWVGAILLVASNGTSPWLHTAGLGFLFVTLSGYALKEQFCFRIPGLRLVPLFLATSLIPLLTGHPLAAGGLLLISGLIYSALVIAKWRMPLHFDVGDKSKYQI